MLLLLSFVTAVQKGNIEGERLNIIARNKKLTDTSIIGKASSVTRRRLGF